MSKTCGECGQSAVDAARFCGHCGAALSADVAAARADGTIAEDDSWVALADAAPPTPQPASTPPAAPTPPAPPSVAPAPPATVVEPALTAPPMAEAAVPHVARGDEAPAATPETAGVDAMSSWAEPPRVRRTGRALWIAAIVLGLFAAGLIVAWTYGWTRGPAFATVADGSDDPATPDEQWRSSYADQFIGSEPVTMITNALANVRDFPTTAGSQIQRSVPEASEVSGRWVRGRDATTRWLKLADGGYIWDGNLAEPGGPNSPIRITFSNRDFSFGPDIDRYMEQATAQSSARSERIADLPDKEREQAYAQAEGESIYIAVPNRRWHGLSVTAVAQHYEAGSIYFRDDIAAVRAAFRSAGIRFDNDGMIDGTSDEEPVSCSIGATLGDERSHGASALTCGV